MKSYMVISSGALLCATFPSFGTAQQQNAEDKKFTPATVPGVVSYAEKINADGETIIRRSIEVDSPDEPDKKIRIGQVLKKLENGDLLLVPGQQPEDADVYRQKICQKMGGIDVTNQSQVVISEETLDGGSCKQPNSKASKYLPKAGAIVNGTFKESPKLKNNGESQTNISGGLQATPNYVTPVAPNTSVIVNQNFFTIGTSYYGTTVAGMVSAKLTVMGRCVMRSADPASAGQTGAISPYVNCLSGPAPGFYPTTLEGCIPAFCRTGMGQVAVFQ
ncbi:hypothetical protein [Dyella flagellata]|uniref:Secreted protein n=1 Tax=Dyella flagellata TaxID=1867833 RepID=A0ABQ5XBK0_9GAMM|nr:hypothetical protein [Dyella flagellata]GLQ88561.1 hypothetical protein GCM10007898_21310 [Dyella flagellata]